MVFPVVMYRWELDDKESCVPKNWHFQIVVLEKTLESPLDSKEIKPVNPKGNQFWIFTGRMDAESEMLLFWPPDANNWFNRKNPDAGKDWRHEEKGTTEDEIVGWHHRFYGNEFEQAPRVGWWTGKPGLLLSMELWKVDHDLVNEKQRNQKRFPYYYIQAMF